MSLQEASEWVHNGSATPPSSPEPECAMSHAQVRTPALQLDVVNGMLRKKSGVLEVELFKYQIWYEAEVRRSQTFQQAFEAQQRKCISMINEHDQEMITLRQDLEIAETLIVTQKEMIDCQAQQQQSASHPVSLGPLLSSYNDQNQPYYQSYYQPPRNQEFTVDPTGLRQIDNYDYNIGNSIDSSCGTQPVMTNSVPEFDQQTSNSIMPSVSSIIHPVSATRDAEVLASTGDDLKRASEDVGAKACKRRKAK